MLKQNCDGWGNSFDLDAETRKKKNNNEDG